MNRRELLAGALTLSGSLAWTRRSLAGDALLLHTASPQNLATPIEYFDRLITPTSVFFVRSHFGPPSLDSRRKVRIEGAKATIELRADELRKQFREVTTTAVLQCAGNGRALHVPRVPGIQWVHGAMGQATWTGVRLADLLAKAGVPADAAHVRLEGSDAPPGPKVPRFVRALPIARALDPSTLVAYRMNGAPLPHVHGGPLRLVVPGWSGNHWVKWLRSVRVQREEVEGFYNQTAYRMPKSPPSPGTPVKPEDTVPVSSFPVKSLISRPLDGASVASRTIEIVGVAFSGEAAIERVEITTDGGNTWARAKLEGQPGVGRWQIFRQKIELEGRGSHRVMARATDARGNSQPREPAWNPSGYHWNGWHGVTLEVRT